MLRSYRTIFEIPPSSPKKDGDEAAGSLDASVDAASIKRAAAASDDSRNVASRNMPASQSALSKSEPHSAPLDFANVDYRAFVFAVHDKHGMLLLHCTRKKKKGEHFQLPGGHIDEHEFISAGLQCNEDSREQLIMAARNGAARELFEETGIDVRLNVNRLKPAPLRAAGSSSTELPCELNHRLYFFLRVTDEDFWCKENHGASSISKLGIVSPLRSNSNDLMLKLSVEHSGFIFEKDPATAAELLTKHSGGKGRLALLMAMNRGSSD